MDEKPTRKELAADYKAARPDAGVFRILNGVSGRSLLGTTQNLASARNKFSFAVSTDSPAALDYRLKADVEAVGLAAFTFEVLEAVTVKADATRAEIESELTTLEALWREKLGADALY